MPASTSSSPDKQLSNVDFPDPDGPVTARNSDSYTHTLTPASVCTDASPVPYVFSIPDASSTTACPSVAPMCQLPPIDGMVPCSSGFVLEPDLQAAITNGPV